ncbi:MAG: RNA methyltransferase, partial [Thermoplasmatales archaeon]|nr:RNA methyltransferase [Thermoplasmatales archaeon]
MPDFYVVLVEPKYGGNVGSVARLMENFDFNDLYLVNPCELDEECYSRAMHAHKILDGAKIFNSFEEAVKNIDYLVATSSIVSQNDKRHLRNAILLDDLSEKLFELDGKIGLVFGREDFGLYNEEISACDIMLRIPTSEAYLSLNLSHAVALVLYSLYIKRETAPIEKKTIGKVEKEKLYTFFSELLDVINYPEHKKEKTEVMFRRI